MRKKKNKAGAPKKSPDKAKGDLVLFRVSHSEKQAFQAAADLDGQSLSVWIRDRLRAVSRAELEAAGQLVPFAVPPK